MVSTKLTIFKPVIKISVGSCKPTAHPDFSVAAHTDPHDRIN